MRLAEPEALVHLGPQASIGGTFAGQASQRGVAGFLTGVADRAATPFQGLGEADLLEVAGGQLARAGHFCARSAVGQFMATAYRAITLAGTWPRTSRRTR